MCGAVENEVISSPCSLKGSISSDYHVREHYREEQDSEKFHLF